MSRRVAGLATTGHMTTRRWFYLVPAEGEPRALVHKIEKRTLAHLPGRTFEYAGRVELEAGLRQLLAGCGTVAMEYSPRAAIPYVSRVDAGTIELVRDCGAAVVSSGDLVQQFEAIWPDGGLATHRAASEALYRIKDRAFALIARRLRDHVPTTEYDIQSAMMTWFGEEGLVTDSAPIVASQENAGDPHYQPTATAARPIGPNEVVLLDLWGKQPTPRAVYADISWMGFTGPAIPAPVEAAFTAIRDARDAAVDLVTAAAAAGREVRGYEADAAARAVLQQRGFGGMISFELKQATQAAAFRFLDALQLVLPATTLGDVYSLALYPVMASHRAVPPAERARLGIGEGLVRLSIGIEDVEDVIADLDHALFAAHSG